MVNEILAIKNVTFHNGTKKERNWRFFTESIYSVKILNIFVSPIYPDISLFLNYKLRSVPVDWIVDLHFIHKNIFLNIFDDKFLIK